MIKRYKKRDEYAGIPYYHLAHMTGGLPTAIINIGIIGMFHKFPFLYVIGEEIYLIDLIIKRLMKQF